MMITIFLVILVTIYVYFKWSYSYWKNRNVFTLPPVIPFGNAKEVVLGKKSQMMRITDIYNECKKRKEPFAGYYVFSRKTFVPVDINLIRDILITDFQYFTDRSNPINDKVDPLRGNLFLLTGAKWKALRAKLSPLFSSGKLKMMFQTFVGCTKNFSHVLDKAIDDGEPIDIKDTTVRYTTDIIGSVAFGINCNCLKNNDSEFVANGKKSLQTSSKSIWKRILLLIHPRAFDVLGIKFTDVDVEKFFFRIVNETIEYRDKNKEERNDFMQLLMNLRDKELKIQSNNNNDLFYQNGLTVEEIAAQSFVFFIAGYDTSSTTLNLLIFELMQNLEIQKKLRDEILTVLEKYGGDITYEAVQDMPYLDKCIYETLRKYPPLPVTFRICTKDYKIPGHDLTIEKGTSVFIPIYGVQHDPEYYPDPEKFDPERFSEENKKKRPTGTFLAFGEGPRICIGLRMGIVQTKVGLIALLRNYRFTLNPKTQVPLEFLPKFLLLNIKGGVWANVETL